MPTNTEQVSVRTESSVVCSKVSKTVDKMYADEDDPVGPISRTGNKRHNEEGEGRQTLDHTERLRIQNELSKCYHPLIDMSSSVYSFQMDRWLLMTMKYALKIREQLLTSFSTSQ